MPSAAAPKNATPNERKITYCRPNVMNTIARYKPEVIIPLGAVAVKSLIGGIWKEKIGSITRWVGWQIPCIAPNAWICPNWHPATFLYEGDHRIQESYFDKYLAAAVHKQGHPWKKVPNYKEDIQIFETGDGAEPWIDAMTYSNEPIAFDYETNMLKPDGAEAAIYSCAMSDGTTTIAFPWQGRAISAFKQFLRRKKTPKIGANIKFEERWSRAILKTKVRGWKWDDILAAHVLDNRSDITSVKFQSFVQLGLPSYDVKIKPFLKAKHANKKNKIHEVDLRDLLLYNGLDALVEWLIGMRQREILKFGEMR
jgi:hypothetical protein